MMPKSHCTRSHCTDTGHMSLERKDKIFNLIPGTCLPYLFLPSITINSLKQVMENPSYRTFSFCLFDFYNLAKTWTTANFKCFQKVQWDANIATIIRILRIGHSKYFNGKPGSNLDVLESFYLKTSARWSQNTPLIISLLIFFLM